MTRWTIRTVGVVVAVALVLPACGGGSDDTSGDGPLTSAESGGTSGTGWSDSFPALVVDGVVSDAALAVVFTEDDQVNPDAMQSFVAEFSALPLDQQEAVVADLALRTELELAAISGLEAAVGGSDATAAALTGTMTKVRAQSDAAAVAAAAQEPEGFRRPLTAPNAAPAPSGGTVAAIGLFNVTATLSAGGASVEPNGSPVPADANSTYTAPDELDKSGTVSNESRSKRGVGLAAVTFTTSKPAAYQIAGGLEDWQVDQVVCDVMAPFTLTSPGVGVAEFSGGLSGTYSATGVFNFQYAGTYQITLENGLGTPGTMIGTSGGSIADQAGSGSENYVLTPTTC